MMSYCALVLERVNIREDGRIKQKIGRVIIGFESERDEQITFVNKYIYYPASDFVHHDVCFLYNGIDAMTIATHGEKISSVIDWMRAAIRFRTVIVCGMQDVKEIIGQTPCTITDLQDFFYTAKSSRILEPVSLSRLAIKYFGTDINGRKQRDPFEECALRLALHHVMAALKICKVQPPFDNDMFPKVMKILPQAPPHIVQDSMTQMSRKNEIKAAGPEMSEASTHTETMTMMLTTVRDALEKLNISDEAALQQFCGMLRFKAEEDLSQSQSLTSSSSVPMTYRHSLGERRPASGKKDDNLEEHVYENDVEVEDDEVEGEAKFEDATDEIGGLRLSTSSTASSSSAGARKVASPSSLQQQPMTKGIQRIVDSRRETTNEARNATSNQNNASTQSRSFSVGRGMSMRLFDEQRSQSDSIFHNYNSSSANHRTIPDSTPGIIANDEVHADLISDVLSHTGPATFIRQNHQYHHHHHHHHNHHYHQHHHHHDHNQFFNSNRVCVEQKKGSSTGLRLLRGLNALVSCAVDSKTFNE